MSKLIIGIAAGRKYDNYAKWLSRSGDVELVKLSYEEDNLSKVSSCKGILLTGGEDVHPKHYGKPTFVDQFRLDDLDEARDAFELKVLAVAHRKRMPLLGICRGMQITNVFLGGTLVPDIVTFGRSNHTKLEEGKDRSHEVWLREGTRLEMLAKTVKGEVNSAHHQSVDLLGESLSMSCVSPDGVIEAAEVKDPDEYPFLMLVQWHPERMHLQDSPFSAGLREAFINAAKKHR
jgi:putative glutamine amidotransferase